MIIIFLVLTLLFPASKQNMNAEYCDISENSCGNLDGPKLIFYNVNPPEGFNLRRDVYMRFAIMLAEARKAGKKSNHRLVLPPWYNLFHWKTQGSKGKSIPWSAFFDVESLKSYAPVVELHEVFAKTTSKTLEIDTLYVLKNFADPFEGGTFTEKWEVESGNCDYYSQFWGYENVTAKEIVCVKYQGKISQLWNLMLVHPNDKNIMIGFGEIPLHDTYGTKSYWDCRKSMKFNKKLVKMAKNYVRKHFNCNVNQCTSYISVHWRRGDFARVRVHDVPSIEGTVKQIDKSIRNNTPNIHKVFIATDASKLEFEQLKTNLNNLGYKVYRYLPSASDIDEFHDGGVAIIDQIICSYAAYFIGTYESTFTYRIQEEREILGFDSFTTFNRLCPDVGECEKVSKWTIVH